MPDQFGRNNYLWISASEFKNHYVNSNRLRLRHSESYPIRVLLCPAGRNWRHILLRSAALQATTATLRYDKLLSQRERMSRSVQFIHGQRP
jgi:hypothetical protein